MANRRVYEIARDRGLTTSELLQRLERDGIHDKKALSTIDEELVDAALADTAPDGESRTTAVHDDQPRGQAEPTGPQLGRIELRRRIRRLRRLHESQLKELGGLAGAPRPGGRPPHEGPGG